MTTHIHQVADRCYMGNGNGKANITLPGPAWQDHATAQHQRPAPEPVRLTKTAPRGVVTAKDRPEPARISECEYARRLAVSVKRTQRAFEGRGMPFKIGGQPEKKLQGVQRGAAPVLDIMPVGEWVTVATVTDMRNDGLPPGEPQVSREATLNNLTRLLRRGAVRKRIVMMRDNDGRFKEAQFWRIK